MAEFFQFGGKPNVQHRDKLQHYRLQIKKLKQMNYILEQRYEKKIENLENQLKMQNKPSQGYQLSGGKLNNQILKRDQEINRLKQQNQRLRRQNKQNPDRHLIAKKRQMFDLVADKDQEIMNLKKTIHELESRYDGKYFNESKFKQEYQMIIKQNQALKRELINKHAQEEKKTEINRDILQGIRYKKEYELLAQENQVLKNEVSRLSMRSGQKIFVNKTLGQNTHNELLKSEAERNSTMNGQLIKQMSKLQSENRELKNQNQNFRKSMNIEKQFESGIVSENKPSKKRIFVYDRQSVSDSKTSNSKQSQMDPEYNSNRYTSTIRKKGLYDQFELQQVRRSSRRA